MPCACRSRNFLSLVHSFCLKSCSLAPFEHPPGPFNSQCTAGHCALRHPVSWACRALGACACSLRGYRTSTRWPGSRVCGCCCCVCAEWRWLVLARGRAPHAQALACTRPCGPCTRRCHSACCAYAQLPTTQQKPSITMHSWCGYDSACNCDETFTANEFINP